MKNFSGLKKHGFSAKSCYSSENQIKINAYITFIKIYNYYI